MAVKANSRTPSSEISGVSIAAPVRISFAESISARSVTVHMSNMMNPANINVAGARDTLIAKSLPPLGSFVVRAISTV
jgi:hypothetical protein